jgi:hypothetical protein
MQDPLSAYPLRPDEAGMLESIRLAGQRSPIDI